MESRHDWKFSLDPHIRKLSYATVDYGIAR